MQYEEAIDSVLQHLLLQRYAFGGRELVIFDDESELAVELGKGNGATLNSGGNI